MASQTADAMQAVPRTVSHRIERFLPPILAGVFFILALIQVSHHIMWRDEVRTWQVCAPCTGLISLWQAMRFEGVPVLWYWIVFVLTRISSNPFLMQFLHVLIATATVFIVARWSPFSIPAKILFAFGYFPFFEYATITRNYALVFLLLLIGCVLISRPKVNLLALTAVMFLLTQVSIWGAGLGTLMVVAGVARAYWNPRAEWPRLGMVILVGIIMLGGVRLSYFEVLPGPGASFTNTWPNATKLDKFLGMFEAVYRGWIPIPYWSEHFWNTNILDYWPVAPDESVNPSAPHTPGFSSIAQALIGALLLLAMLLFLARRPIALAVLLFGAGSLMGFEFVFRGVARHHGHLFMLLIVANWLAETTPALATKHNGLERLTAMTEKLRRPALLGLLGINLLAGVAAAIGGFLVPFSATRATAEYIHANFEPEINLAAIPDYCASPIAQQLGRPIFFPQMRKAATYNTQDDLQRYSVDAKIVLEDCLNLIQSNGHDLILIFSSEQTLTERDLQIPFRLPGGNTVVLDVKVLGSFPRSVVADEVTKLYKMSIANRPGPAKTP